jgi:hypothetical protein
MAASIGDWYENAEGRRAGGFRFDPENDDPADRTPDAWLDDLHAPPEPEHRRAPRARSAPLPPSPADSPARGRRSTDRTGSTKLSKAVSAARTRNPKITLKAMTKLLRRELAMPSLTADRVADVLAQQEGPIMASDARAMMTVHPGIQPKKIAVRLRELGWPDATAAMVQTALRLYPAPAADRKAKAVPKASKGAVPAQKATMSSGAMARRIRSLDASAPGWTVPVLTKKIREYGWPHATQADVIAALLGSDQPATAKERKTKPARKDVGSRAGKPAPALSPRKVETVPGGRSRAPKQCNVKQALDREARIREIVADKRGSGNCPDPVHLLIVLVVFTRLKAIANATRLLQLLHRCGWSSLRQDHAERLAVEAAVSNYSTFVGIVCDEPALTVAVRAMRAAGSGASAPRIASSLQQYGWARANPMNVDRILRLLRTPKVQLPPQPSRKRRTNPARPVQRIASTPVQPVRDIPGRTLDIPVRPNVNQCHGCGRAISSLGICGCS